MLDLSKESPSCFILRTSGRPCLHGKHLRHQMNLRWSIFPVRKNTGCGQGSCQRLLPCCIACSVGRLPAGISSQVCIRQNLTHGWEAYISCAHLPASRALCHIVRSTQRIGWYVSGHHVQTWCIISNYRNGHSTVIYASLQPIPKSFIGNMHSILLQNSMGILFNQNE